MKDLYRCLDQYPPQLLEAIAAAWDRVAESVAPEHAPVARPDADSREAIERLVATMLSPALLAAMVQSLSPSARDVLGQLLEEGGALPGHRLSVRYGAIRRLGPARLIREQPWNQPDNVLEELYYRGLIYRAYGSLGNFYGEVVLIAEQMQAPLAALGLALGIEWTPAEEPALVQRDGDALIEDVVAVLARIRRNQPRLPDEEDDDAPDNGQSEGIPALLRSLDMGARLIGEASPERLSLLVRILWRLRLIQEDRRVLRPTVKAREWLHLPDIRRRRALLLAWRDDPTWNELSFLPALRQATLAGEAIAQPGHPVNARRVLLELLARHPVGRWISLDGLVQMIKARRPDYLRPDGDYDSWGMVDAETGESLHGFAAWDRIEGQLAVLIISGPLRWLGMVEVGLDEAQGDPVAFRLTPRGAAMLAALRPGKSGASAEPPADEADVPAATIDPDLLVTIPLRGTLYERYQLERFANWQGQDTAATYLITPESVWEGYNAGIRMEQILRFLQRITHDSVPPAVTTTLQAWGGRFGSVRLTRMVLLQTVDEQTMKQITARADVRALLGQRLSATAYLVEEQNMPLLTELLKARGIWPMIR
jgi:hypothetical protein